MKDENNMRATGNKLIRCSPRNSFLTRINSESSPFSEKLRNSKLHSRVKRERTKKRNDTLRKFIESLPKFSDRHSSLKLLGKKIYGLDDRNAENASIDGAIGRPRRRKRRRRRRKKNVAQDEASCLQRRARYLLVKMKLELNLIDAYSADGWKGQSKEKIKPEKELQRAGKQILKCKLGIRDTIRQLGLLSSEGCITDSVMHTDGSVFHEHIFCAKCKSREAFPDDEIILCDGTCNCAFHQKCLDPPLEKIPSADQGWLCKICVLKMEILEAINAHVGTSFTVNDSWEDIFKEATTAPSAENTSLNPNEEWPSEDSNDEDYDPEMVENDNSWTVIEESMCVDAGSSSSLFGLSDEVRSYSTNCQRLDVKSKSVKELEAVDSASSIHSDECGDHEITSYHRKRRFVDYKKLHDEMFGKELNDGEQQSEDEDWGPQRRRRRRRELDADSMMICRDEDGCSVLVCGNEDGCSDMIVPQNISHDRRKLFRIPHSAVEVSKWFKNARYAALRIRKYHQQEERTNAPSVVADTKRSIRKAGKQRLDGEESLDSSYLLPLSSLVRVPKSLKGMLRRKKSPASTRPKKQQWGAANALSTDKHQVPNASKHSKETFSGGRTGPKAHGITESEKLYLVEMERVFSLEDRLRNLTNTLLTCIDDGQVQNKTHPKEQNVMYIPVVVELKEKSCKCISS